MLILVLVLLFLLLILLRIGTVILTLAGILALTQEWMLAAIQLTKYNHNYQYDTKTFTNKSTNISMKNTCQHNTETFISISTNTTKKKYLYLYGYEQLYRETFTDTTANTLLRLTSILIDVDIKLVSILSAATMLLLTFALL